MPSGVWCCFSTPEGWSMLPFWLRALAEFQLATSPSFYREVRSTWTSAQHWNNRRCFFLIPLLLFIWSNSPCVPLADGIGGGGENTVPKISRVGPLVRKDLSGKRTQYEEKKSVHRWKLPKKIHLETQLPFLGPNCFPLEEKKKKAQLRRNGRFLFIRQMWENWGDSPFYPR